MTATDIRLLKDIHQICRIPLDMGGGIRACDLCDPYAVVLLTDGSVVLVQLVEGGSEREDLGGDGEAKLQLSWPDLQVFII